MSACTASGSILSAAPNACSAAEMRDLREVDPPEQRVRLDELRVARPPCASVGDLLEQRAAPSSSLAGPASQRRHQDPRARVLRRGRDGGAAARSARVLASPAAAARARGRRACARSSSAPRRASTRRRRRRGAFVASSMLPSEHGDVDVARRASARSRRPRRAPCAACPASASSRGLRERGEVAAVRAAVLEELLRVGLVLAAVAEPQPAVRPPRRRSTPWSASKRGIARAAPPCSARARPRRRPRCPRRAARRSLAELLQRRPVALRVDLVADEVDPNGPIDGTSVIAPPPSMNSTTAAMRHLPRVRRASPPRAPRARARGLRRADLAGRPAAAGSRREVGLVADRRARAAPRARSRRCRAAHRPRSSARGRAIGVVERVRVATAAPRVAERDSSPTDRRRPAVRRRGQPAVRHVRRQPAAVHGRRQVAIAGHRVTRRRAGIG